MATSVKLTKEGEEIDPAKTPYSELVGALLYLAVCTRPDISQSVGAAARYMSTPKMQHWQVLKTIVRYLKGTLQHCLVYHGDDLQVVGYCDSDYAGELDNRRSTTGYMFMLNGGAISWSSRLQPTVAASTVEAEYMAAAGAVKEALWIRKLMRILDLEAECVPIHGDNQGTLKLLKHPIASARSKHIDVLHHFARERVRRGEVCFKFLRTEEMVADIFTKPLPKGKFESCRDGLGLLNTSSGSRGSVEE
jgi:hypothetical protein